MARTSAEARGPEGRAAAPPPSRRTRARYLALSLTIASLVIAGLLLPREAARGLRQTPHAPRVEPEADAVAELDRAADGLPIRPHEADPPAIDGPMHPHPITPAHQRIYRENNLVGALNLAVDYEDPARIRELLAQYRAEYPEDDHRLQGGYEIIADCLEHLDESTRARARHFWETEIRSQTRRYVRRYCLQR